MRQHCLHGARAIVTMGKRHSKPPRLLNYIENIDTELVDKNVKVENTDAKSTDNNVKVENTDAKSVDGSAKIEQTDTTVIVESLQVEKEEEAEKIPVEITALHIEVKTEDEKDIEDSKFCETCRVKSVMR